MTEPQGQQPKGQPGSAEAALFGLCPQCGAKTLFRGPVQFADKCGACGLDYGQFNVGDGPAAFLTLIVGALVATLAIIVQLKFDPPFWVHAVLWIPFTTGAVVLGLRMAKAWLLGAEFRRKAGEGKIKDQ